MPRYCGRNCFLGLLAGLAGLAGSFLSGAALGQSLEPRAYSPSPVGTNFLVASYSNLSGAVAFDGSSPFSNVNVDANFGAVGYGHVFGIAGDQASVTAVLPYAWGHASGDVGDTNRYITRSGLDDMLLRFSMTFLGGPALDKAEFAAHTPGPSLGATISVIAPTGQYDPSKLVNIGQNRWAVQPQIGGSIPHGPWVFDIYAAVWIYQNNDDYYGGKQKTQDPVYSTQAHLSYTFRPRLWLAVDATYYHGGIVKVDGVPTTGVESNARAGVTLSLPLGRGSSLKLNASDGAVTRVGGDFKAFGIAWQHAWGD